MSVVLEVMSEAWDLLAEAAGKKYGWKGFVLALLFPIVLIALVIGAIFLV